MAVRVTKSSHFYPRPPRGGRRLCCGSRYSVFCISIHALREEGDELPCSVVDMTEISIHALREEGDGSRSGTPVVD